MDTLISKIPKPIREAFSILKYAYQRDLPSVEHKVAWTHFERICHYRANVGFISKLVFQVFFIALGQANF